MGKQIFKQLTFWSMTLLSSLGLVALLLTGCADNGTAPQPDRLDAALEWLQGNVAGPGATAISGAEADALLNDPDYVDDDKGSVVADEEGGVLTLEIDDQEIIFTIPAGAVPVGTKIEIWGFKFKSGFGEVFVYDCQPTGIHFERPLEVYHPLSRPGGDMSGLFYLGDYSYFWQLEDTERNDDGYVTFKIHHFSKYGIS